jgi:hypothetical protein
MLTRRSVLKRGGCAALVTGLPLFGRSANAQTPITLVGQNGTGWTLVGGANQSNGGEACAYGAGYTATPGVADTAWFYVTSNTTAHTVKVCAYDASGALVAVSSPITLTSGLQSAPISCSLTAQTYTLVVVPDSGYVGFTWNSGSSGFKANQWLAAHYSYTSPPGTLPTPDQKNLGYEFIVYLTGTPTGSTLSQGAAFTLTGTGFGSKSRSLTPIVRDKGLAATNTLDSQWSASASLPSDAANPTFNIQNRDVGFSPTGAAIGAPHSFVPRIVAGCNGSAVGGDGNSGIGIQLSALINPKTTTLTFPLVVYGCCWYRADPNWQFGLGSPPDNNYKHWAWFDGHQEGYCAYAPGFPSSNSQTSFQLVTSVAPSIYQDPDANGHGLYWPASSDPQPPYVHSVNPFNPAQGVNGWIFEEWECLVTPTAGLAGGGYLVVKQFGQQIINYAGQTDGADLTGNERFLTFGGYNRSYPSSDNWRYFADLLADATSLGTSAKRVARVMFGNASTLAASTLLSPADLTSWSNTSISGTFWRAAFASGTTVYAHVVCENGTVFNAVKSYVVS